MHVYDTGANSNYAMGCLSSTVLPDTGPAWHLHTRECEVFYIRSGSFHFETGSSEKGFDLQEGDLIYLPTGDPHRFWNSGSDLGEVISFQAPGGMMQFFIELSQPLGDEDRMPSPNEFEQFGKRFGAWMLREHQSPSESVLPMAKDDPPLIGKQSEWPSSPGVNVQPLLSETNGSLPIEVFLIRLPPGGETPWLQHSRFSFEAFVLEGDLNIESDDQKLKAARNSLAIAQFGSRYRISNQSEAMTTLLAASVPGGLIELYQSGFAKHVANARGVLVD